MSSPFFDRDIPLAELMNPKIAAKLSVALSAIAGPNWKIVDALGEQVLANGGHIASDAIDIALAIDIEPIGSLVASGVTRECASGVARWLELVLAGEARYRMAADIHLEAVNADYVALQHKHAQLQASEQKYRELAMQLEERVEEQVKTISLAQRKLYQSEKMASVGSLAAGMAHEINNPIGFIRSNINTGAGYLAAICTVLKAFRRDDRGEAMRLWQDQDLDFVLEELPDMLAESISGADRIARIVANLKKYAGIDYSVSARVDLNDAISTVAGLIKDQMPDHIALEMDLQPLPLIECDQGRINQMLLSIMQNAQQAITGPGAICVTTQLVDSEIHIAIRDNGCGIAADVLPRIFDPFFTTRDIGKGTGLGLTVCADIASVHGGRILVDSKLGVGSTFTVVIPLEK